MPRPLSGSPRPRLEIIETATGESLSIPYDAVGRVRFTGKDMAAGKSHEAWKRRRDAQARAADPQTQPVEQKD